METACKPDCDICNRYLEMIKSLDLPTTTNPA